MEKTEREVYAISRGISHTSRRRRFGTIELTRKLFKQLKDHLSDKEILELDKEWRSLAGEAFTPSKVKTVKKVEKIAPKDFTPVSEDELDSIE